MMIQWMFNEASISSMINSRSIVWFNDQQRAEWLLTFTIENDDCKIWNEGCLDQERSSAWFDLFNALYRAAVNRPQTMQIFTCKSWISYDWICLLHRIRWKHVDILCVWLSYQRDAYEWRRRFEDLIDWSSAIYIKRVFYHPHCIKLFLTQQACH